ncbi:MAG: alpha/beta hydrolase, partial [Chitinophagaceae bacterium]
AGEEAMRELFIYLPPDYSSSLKHYPVVYYLHGFGGSQNDYFFLDIDKLLDEAIKEKTTLPFILVVPNSSNKFGGSFYSNSDINGLWTDYIGKDVVAYVDAHYRTIPNKNSRGICGHSMGGQGALKVAMLFPDVFGSVYSMSPSILNWGADFHPKHPSFQTALKAQTMEALIEDPYAHAFAAMGRVFSPESSNRPFGIRLPIQSKAGIIEADSSIIRKWEANFVNNMLHHTGEGLKHLNGLAIDWGKNDDYTHIPSSCRELCHMLDSMQIRHIKEEYEGRHIDKITGKEGRLAQKVIPFFSSHLSF